MLRSNKGYSLMEIGVGILILTVFLFFSVGLFNACYNNYRRIKQRNIAIDRAVYYMENMLQTDSDVLTGFFIQTLDPATNRYSLGANPLFKKYVKDHISQFKSEFAKFKGIDISEVTTPTDDELEEFIQASKDYLINEYIKYDAINDSSVAQLQNGAYGFLTEEGRFMGDNYEIIIQNEQLDAVPQSANYEFTSSNGGAFRLKKTISRIPVSNGRAFGNQVLRLQVDVYYTNDFSKALTEENMQIITLKTIKL